MCTIRRCKNETDIDTCYASYRRVVLLRLRACGAENNRGATNRRPGHYCKTHRSAHGYPEAHGYAYSKADRNSETDRYSYAEADEDPEAHTAAFVCF